MGGLRTGAFGKKSVWEIDCDKSSISQPQSNLRSENMIGFSPQYQEYKFHITLIYVRQTLAFKEPKIYVSLLCERNYLIDIFSKYQPCIDLGSVRDPIRLYARNGRHTSGRRF